MIDWILVLLSVAAGIAIGFLTAMVVLKKATPQQLYDRLVWALDKAEDYPQLRALYENLAGQFKDKLDEWLKAKWVK